MVIYLLNSMQQGLDVDLICLNLALPVYLPNNHIMPQSRDDYNHLNDINQIGGGSCGRTSRRCFEFKQKNLKLE